MESGQITAARKRAFAPGVALAVLATAAVLGGGCAAKPLYYWGNYEQVIYRSYARPGDADPMRQIAELEEDVEKARSKSYRLPPGFHAHLGTLYFETGDPGHARDQFQTEKAQFPESAVLMDRLLNKLQPPNASGGGGAEKK